MEFTSPDGQRFEIEDELWKACRFAGWRAPGSAFVCTIAAETLPLVSVSPPILSPMTRAFDPVKLVRVMDAIRNGEPLPPVPVFWEAQDSYAQLLDGAHRYFVSVAVGFSEIPIALQSAEWAEVLYGYRSPYLSQG